MSEWIVLTADDARLEVAPHLGGAIMQLRVGALPVLRPWSGAPGATGAPGGDAFDSGCIVLAPFSNRISKPFEWEGRTHALTPNRPGSPFPIHGDAWARAWTVESRQAGAVRLGLEDGGFGPFRYEARLSYVLSPDALVARLTLTSRATSSLPFGVGFHPWFPKSAETRLQFAATGVWLSDDRRIPTGVAPAPIPTGWDFSAPRPLPRGLIDNGFAGWDGVARITQGADAVSVDLSAGKGLGTLLVFSPDEAAGFFCAEPVSHPVDAHNLPGRPGLVTLAPGETLEAEMRLEWRA